MKFTTFAGLALAAVVLVPLAVLFFLGGLRGEARHVVSIDIARPPSTVFAALMARVDRAALVHVEDNARLEYAVSRPPEYTGTARYDLDDMGGRGTRLTYRETRRYQRLRDKLLEPLISRQVQQDVEAALARLKQEIEEAPQSF